MQVNFSSMNSCPVEQGRTSLSLIPKLNSNSTRLVDTFFLARSVGAQLRHSNMVLTSPKGHREGFLKEALVTLAKATLNRKSKLFAFLGVNRSARRVLKQAGTLALAT